MKIFRVWTHIRISCQIFIFSGLNLLILIHFIVLFSFYSIDFNTLFCNLMQLLGSKYLLWLFLSHILGFIHVWLDWLLDLLLVNRWLKVRLLRYHFSSDLIQKLFCVWDLITDILSVISVICVIFYQAVLCIRAVL